MLRIGTTRIAVGEQFRWANMPYMRIVCFISMEKPKQGVPGSEIWSHGGVAGVEDAAVFEGLDL